MMGKKKGKESLLPEPEEEFVVEKCIDKRLVAGKIQYLLKWKGYPEYVSNNLRKISIFFYFVSRIVCPPVHSSENTWEPNENLDCSDLISEFERNYKKKSEDKIERSDMADKKRKLNGTDDSSATKKKKLPDVRDVGCYLYGLSTS